MYTVLPDTAATSHCLETEVIKYRTKVKNSIAPGVTLVNGNLINPQKQVIVPLSSQLSDKSKKALICDDLKTG